MLHLTQTQRQEMLTHARREAPRECCGILLGLRDGAVAEVREVIACANAATDPRVRYQIAASDLLKAQRSARRSGLAIIGFYHSHPAHAALLSETDRREAFWTGCSYVIVSLIHEQVRSFHLGEQGLVEELVELTPEA